MRHALSIAFLILGASFVVPPTSAWAQQSPSPRAEILTIDIEKMFLNSDFGKDVAAEVEVRGTELAAENRRIEAELAAEEKNLTDLRTTMTATEFRPLADDFDARVQETRRTQAVKNRALNELLGQKREVFLNAAGPVLQQLMEEVGASVVLERRSIFISSSSSDITAAAITRLNATLVEGASPDPDPQD